MAQVGFPKEDVVSPVREDHEATCWGCGLGLLLPSRAPNFKCGWCGAVTNEKVWKDESKSVTWWRRLRDRCLVSTLGVYILFLTCAGVWAVYPSVFSISYFCGIFHSTLTAILVAATLSSFSLAAFRCAGAPPNIVWGSYPVVGKGFLENYTFCHYCSKPKSPRTHHCRSCGMCILDMDHHCPFIGNCVGAANHRHFVIFLISAVTSMIYVSIMTVHAALQLWPELQLHELRLLNGLNRFDTDSAFRLVKEIMFALLRSSLVLSPRALLIVYLFISSVSVNIGLSVLLWQQFCFIYEGKTYLSHLSSQGMDGEKDCKNISRFFGCPYSVFRYLPNYRNSRKRHRK